MAAIISTITYLLSLAKAKAQKHYLACNPQSSGLCARQYMYKAKALICQRGKNHPDRCSQTACLPDRLCIEGTVLLGYILALKGTGLTHSHICLSCKDSWYCTLTDCQSRQPRPFAKDRQSIQNTWKHHGCRQDLNNRTRLAEMSLSDESPFNNPSPYLGPSGQQTITKRVNLQLTVFGQAPRARTIEIQVKSKG